MLFFGQPFVGVAERAPLTDQELAEGDEFFDEWLAMDPAYCDDRTMAAGGQPMPNFSGYGANFGYPQQMGGYAVQPMGGPMPGYPHAQPRGGQRFRPAEEAENAEYDAAFDAFLRESGQA